MNPSTPDVRNSRCACNGPGCPDCNFDEFAGEPDVSHNRGNASATAQGLSGNSVSRGHGVQGDPATAASCTTLALETAAGIQLEELAEVCGEGETGWNAQRRNDIARKMQRIAANCPNRYSHDELMGTVVRAERGELRS